MAAKLNINGQQVPYRVIKSRGRRISLRFSVKAPLLEIRTPSGRFGQAEQVAIAQQEEWILKHYTQRRVLWQRRASLQQTIEQGQILYQGELIPWHTQPAERSRVSLDEEGLHLQLSPADLQRPRLPMLYQAMRTLAKGVLTPMVYDIAQRTGSRVNQVRVKDVTSRWGSCSSQANINLNWYLIMIDPELIEYLIIHELMHLREMNHSPQYWAWVEKFCPHYQAADRRLSEQEWLIGLFDEWLRK